MIDVDKLVSGDSSGHLRAGRRAAQYALRTMVNDAPNGRWQGKEVEEYDGTEPIIVNELDISAVVDAATLEVLSRIGATGSGGFIRLFTANSPKLGRRHFRIAWPDIAVLGVILGVVAGAILGLFVVRP